MARLVLLPAALTPPFPRAAPAAGFRAQPGLAAGLGEIAHAQDVALALGHRDHATRIEQVEDVAGLEALVIGGQHHLVMIAPVARSEDGAAGFFRVAEMAKQRFDIGMLEIVARIFLLRLEEDIAVSDAVFTLAAVEIQVVDVLDALHIHGQPLEPIGQLARDR